MKPRLTLRIGQQLITEVKDFICIIRGEDNTIQVFSTSDSFSLGAMEDISDDIRYKREMNRKDPDA